MRDVVPGALIDASPWARILPAGLPVQGTVAAPAALVQAAVFIPVPGPRDETALNLMPSKIDVDEKGQPGGVATLDQSGQVPLGQLPEIPTELPPGDGLLMSTNGNRAFASRLPAAAFPAAPSDAEIPLNGVARVGTALRYRFPDGTMMQLGDFNTLNAEVQNRLGDLTQSLADIAQSKAGVEAATAEALGVAGIAAASISDTSADPPAAANGVYGAKYTADNLWQRLKRVAGAWVTVGSPLMTLLGAQLRQPDIRVDDYISDWNASHNAAFSAAQAAAMARGIDPGTPSIQLTPGRMYRLHEWEWNPRVSLIGGAGRLSSTRLLYDGSGGTDSSILKPISGSSYGQLVGIEFVGANFPWSGVTTVIEPDYLIDFGTNGLDHTGLK